MTWKIQETHQYMKEWNRTVGRKKYKYESNTQEQKNISNKKAKHIENNLNIITWYTT